MFAGSIATLWLAALLSVSPTVRPQNPDRAEFCSAGSDVARFSVLRENILSKLGMFVPSNNLTSQWSSHESVHNASRRVDPALVTAYEAVSRALEEEDSTVPPGCARGRGTTAFAKRISLFFPVECSVTYMHSATPESEEGHQDVNTTRMATIPIRYTLVFNLSLPSQPLYSAELRLFARRASTCTDMVFQNVEVFHVSRRNGEEERLLVTSKNVEVNKEVYESFDVLQAVNKWIDNGMEERLELDVVLNCPFSTTTGAFTPPTIEFAANNITRHLDREEMRPQLVVATVTEEVAAKLGQKQRKRRQVVDTQYCNHNPDAVHCCIRKLVVDFHRDLNLTFVVYPFTFKPNFCQGLCPVPYLEDNFLQVSIQQYYQTNDLGGGPCCTIYSMDPLLMMLRDQATGTVIMAEVPDMQITSCGCVD